MTKLLDSFHHHFRLDQKSIQYKNVQIGHRQQRRRRGCSIGLSSSTRRTTITRCLGLYVPQNTTFADKSTAHYGIERIAKRPSVPRKGRKLRTEARAVKPNKMRSEQQVELRRHYSNCGLAVRRSAAVLRCSAVVCKQDGCMTSINGSATRKEKRVESVAPGKPRTQRMVRLLERNENRVVFKFMLHGRIES